MSSCVCKAYPGYVLSQGQSNNSVSNVQYYLNSVKTRYPQIPAVTVDGNYGPATANSVRVFQQTQNLVADGKVGWSTWKAFCQQLCVDPVKPIAKPWPGNTYSLGSTGNPVRDIQVYLGVIATQYPIVQRVDVDGVFGTDTLYSIQLFQELYGMRRDGMVGQLTWNKLIEVYTSVMPA